MALGNGRDRVLRNIRWKVDSATAGTRLDRAVLLACPTTSRGLVRRAIEAGEIRVNGAVVRRKGRHVRVGDLIEVGALPQRGESWVRPDFEVPFEILAQASSWLAVSKPAGVPVYPLRLDELGTLANALAARVPDCLAVGEVETGMGGIVHRLDTGTSGVVLVARRADAWKRLRDQFAQGRVEKVYLAVVEGIVRAPGRVSSWLTHTPGRPGHMRVVAHPAAAGGARALWAVSEYSPLRCCGNRTLLWVKILTGVTHQIRCQLAHLGHPVVGDSQYGAGPHRRPERHWLHAAEIEFDDPDSGGRQRVVCPPPAEWYGVLRGQD
ncbi:MAG: RluA family pseudouridine synthase [Kiritimatiellae bacterium]|nr:RluA family pseudouridine synthase [Kiritimatiellia bacterium]